MKINVEISCGELLDKLTILEIKSQKITNQKKTREYNKREKTIRRIFRIA